MTTTLDNYGWFRPGLLLATAGRLTNRLRLSATYISMHGWAKHTEFDVDGHVCLTGAVRLCDPQPGDAWLLRQVLRHKGHAEHWNDETARSLQDVLQFLCQAVITEDDLAETFGPDWKRVVSIVLDSGRNDWRVLCGADLRNADLRGVDLGGADLSNADFRGADLSNANLSRAFVEGADFEGANLVGAKLSNAYGDALQYLTGMDG